MEEKPKAAKAETPKRKKERAPRRAEREMQDLEPVIEKIPEDELIDVQDHAALKFLEEVTKEMGLDLDIKAKAGKETLYIDIQGKDSGTVIGKRGQTLDAIQYLTSLVVNLDTHAGDHIDLCGIVSGNILRAVYHQFTNHNIFPFS